MIVESPKILVIDDDYSFRKAVTKLLEAKGYRVAGEGGSLKVINTIIKEKPDLILLDLNMPETDGIEIIQAMRRMKMEIPVVVISGNMNQIDLRIMHDRGAVDFLVKPVHMKTLLEKIKKVLEPAA